MLSRTVAQPGAATPPVRKKGKRKSKEKEKERERKTLRDGGSQNGGATCNAKKYVLVNL